MGLVTAIILRAIPHRKHRRHYPLLSIALFYHEITVFYIASFITAKGHNVQVKE